MHLHDNSLCVQAYDIHVLNSSNDIWVNYNHKSKNNTEKPVCGGIMHETFCISLKYKRLIGFHLMMYDILGLNEQKRQQR